MDVHLKHSCSLNHLVILSSLLKLSKDHEVGEIIKDIVLIFVQQQIFEIHEVRFDCKFVNRSKSFYNYVCDLWYYFRSLFNNVYWK